MVSTRKLACPSCDVKLRVADTLAAGKRIKCPKCGEGFAVPDGNGPSPAPKAAVASSTYSFPQQEAKAKPKSVRKAAPPPDEENDLDEKVAVRPKPRKRRKQGKETTSNAPLVWGLVLGGGLPLIVAVVLGLIFRPWEKKSEAVAVNTPARASATEPGPSGPGQSARRRGPGGREPGAEPLAPTAPQSAADPGTSGPASTAGGSDLIAAGQRVYQANNCARCHAMGGGGRGGRGPRGPDLSRTGAEHSADWLLEQIRDPHSHKPDSRMPSYGDKISDGELRALASYLASLK